MQHKYVVTVETSEEGSLHYSETEEKPAFKLISIHSTVESANHAAKQHALYSGDLPGHGEEERYWIAKRGARMEGGCYSCYLDLMEFAGSDDDIANAFVQVKKMALHGPLVLSARGGGRGGNDDLSRDRSNDSHGHKKKATSTKHSNDDEDDDITFVKEVKKARTSI